MFDFLSKAGSSVMDSLSSVGSSVADGVQSGLAHTFEKLQDPEFMQQAGLMGAALSNDNNRYQSALNAYDSRRQEIARQKREDMQRAQAREEKLADRDEGRNYNEQQDYLSNFTPESVQAFRESGDQSVLVKKPIASKFRTENRGNETWEVEVDPTTGLDVPNGIVRKVGWKADEPKNGNGKGSTITLPDGSVVDSIGVYDIGGGNYYKVELSANGNLTAKRVSETEAKALRGTGDEATASTTQANGDIDIVANFIKDGDLTPYTGVSAVYREDGMALGADTRSAYASGDDREFYLAAERLNKSMTKLGVEEAKAMGASGINSVAEFKIFESNMPKLDFTSPDSLKTSFEKLQNYIQQYNKEAAARKVAQGASPTNGQTQQPAPSEVTNGDNTFTPQELAKIKNLKDDTIINKNGERFRVVGGVPSPIQ